MHDKGFASGFSNGGDKVTHVLVAVLIINADPMLNSYINTGTVLHSLNTVSDQLRMSHQACAYHVVLNPIARAAHVKVHLIVAPFLSVPGAGGEL